MKRAFTLIELIVVIAITAVLLTIIAVPVVQSFNLTRAAQGFADAQAKARELVEQIENEIANSAGVRDNTGIRGSVDIPVPGADGSLELVRLPYSKIDIIQVAQGDPGSRVGTAYRDPDTGKVDPTLTAPKGQPQFPAVPGNTVVRYWIGLRDPGADYFNPYVQYRTPANTPWMQGAGRDNLFVLYRAEVEPYVWRDYGFGPERVVNTAYFVDGDRDNDPNTQGIVYDDPQFFLYGDANAVYSSPRSYDPASWEQIARNWKEAATVVTEFSRYDMVMAKVNPATQAMQFVGNVPALVSLVRFQPARIANETAAPRLAVGSGQETENAINIGADIFGVQYADIADVRVTVYPSTGPGGSGPLADSAGRRVEVDVLPTGILESGLSAPNTYSLFYNGNEVFNFTNYLYAKQNRVPYAFTQSLVPGNIVGLAARDFIPMVPQVRQGSVQASFEINEHGTETTDGNGAAIPYESRIPSTQNNEPGIASGPLATPAQPAYQAPGLQFDSFNNINERFAVQWNLWDGLFPGGSAPSKESEFGPKRYVDLRLIPQYGASLNVPSPLSPSWGWVRANIVPGSVEVYGPDQRPGPGYGQTVRYTEVPNSGNVKVGPNQFKVNYTYKANEPDWTGLFGFGAANYDPTFYNAGDFLSSTLQARYRPGYMEFNSDFGDPLPVGNIYVKYRFQFTDSKTIVAVDYDSRELIDVVLTVRNYPQTTIPNPQMITVRGSAAVKNTLR